MCVRERRCEREREGCERDRERMGVREIEKEREKEREREREGVRGEREGDVSERKLHCPFSIVPLFLILWRLSIVVYLTPL